MFASSNVFGQDNFIPVDHEINQLIDRIEIKSGALSNALFTSQKGYNIDHALFQLSARDTLNQFQDPRNQFLINYTYDDLHMFNEDRSPKSRKPFLKAVYPFETDFFYLDKEDFRFSINPVLHFQYGADFDNTLAHYTNTRGAEIKGLLFDKVAFYSFFSENQVLYPSFVRDQTALLGALPGEGGWRNIGNDGAVDFFRYRGSISIPIFKKINFQFGHDKLFIGNGVRSLFVSDNAAPHLYGKLTARVWRFSYQTIWSEYIDQFDIRAGDQLLDRKYTATHHLSYNINRWLNIGLFETIVYRRVNGFDLNYLNPVIFYKAIEWYLGSPDNALVGLDFKMNLIPNTSIYGQVLLDEFNQDQLFAENKGWWANKYGFQLGLKYIDVAGINQLDFQAELNAVRPFTYSHNLEGQNYTHYNQAIAHPLGSNFVEYLGRISYRPINRLKIENRIMFAQKGLDYDTLNLGGNIFRENTDRSMDFGNSFLQGNLQTVLLNDFRISYMPWHNVWFDLQYLVRRSEDELNIIGEQQTNYLSLGIRTNMALRSDFY